MDYTSQPEGKQTDFPEIRRKWQPKKMRGQRLSAIMNEAGLTKHARAVVECGSVLGFTKPDATGKRRLAVANFCKVRLCPMCNWRRTLKIGGQLSQVFDVGELTKKYSCLFLTLTVPNVPGAELRDTLKRLTHSFANYLKLKKIAKAVKGYARSVEVTYNRERDDFHPHIHTLLLVSKYYFKSRDYIREDDWRQMWRDAYNDQSITQVKIEKCYDRPRKKISEVAKYAVKDTDYLKGVPRSKQVEIVKWLDEALFKIRLVGYGGVIKELRKELCLDDSEDGDLIHTDKDDTINGVVAAALDFFYWNGERYAPGKPPEKSPAR